MAELGRGLLGGKTGVFAETAEFTGEAELVTNAVRAVRTLGPLPSGLWPVGVEITATPRFVHVAVTDIDHRPIGGANEGGRLADNGRGLSIVDALAAMRWVVYDEHRKAAHVLIAAPGVTFTPAELHELRWPR